LNSWQNQNLIVLEKHPLFSALPKEQTTLSSGEIQLNYIEKKSVSNGPSNCIGAGSGFGYGGRLGLGANFCSQQREIKEENCVHQFTVKNNKVINYKVLGENGCYTTCKNTPNPSQCKK
jgi:hypothetical protein